MKAGNRNWFYDRIETWFLFRICSSNVKVFYLTEYDEINRTVDVDMIFCSIFIFEICQNAKSDSSCAIPPDGFKVSIYWFPIIINFVHFEHWIFQNLFVTVFRHTISRCVYFVFRTTSFRWSDYQLLFLLSIKYPIALFHMSFSSQRVVNFSSKENEYKMQFNLL